METFLLEEVFLKRPQGDYSLFIEKFYVRPGEHLAITGPSGSGKSTALDLLALALEPTDAKRFEFSVGDSTFDIKKLWTKKRVDLFSDLRKDFIGVVLQTGGLFPFLTVEENINLTSKLKGCYGRKEDKEWTDSLIKTLQLSDLVKSKPSSLSIGERQRVAIARALNPRPNIILADEPTAALDPMLAKEVMGLFLTAIERFDSSLIMVSHDLRLVEEFGLIPVSISANENSQRSVLLRE